jgi:Zn-dependent M28 family amino/carboxypeptidase
MVRSLARPIFILLCLLYAGMAVAQTLSADRIKQDVRTLSSDAFQGRGPGEIGEEKTLQYLVAAFERAGLEPGGESGSWYQVVPLIRFNRQPDAQVSLSIKGKTLPLVLGRTATLNLRNPGHSNINAAPLVFVGYGVSSPDMGWDVYSGIDMTGKVAVVLCNDPDFEAGRDLGFEGRRMAYAGRVSAKFEAAARAGALGVVILHEDEAASYPYSQVANGDSLPVFIFQPPKPSKLQFSTWLSPKTSMDLLKRSGLDLETLKQRARDPGFRAFPMARTSISAVGDVVATPFVTRNVIARLKGASRPDETVIYGAHWDANGKNSPTGHGDDIRRGAIDNATGTSELLEIARAFTTGPKPERSVIFAAWTSEEKGLMGSDWYAEHPLYPLATTVANINLDPHVLLPAARDIELIGGGRTTLEQDFAQIAQADGLKLVEESSPEAGWYFRSDQYSFARRGVPALAFRAGRDLVIGGRPVGQNLVETYNRQCYHQTCDRFNPKWDFAGSVQEATIAFHLGQHLANGTSWPDWFDGTPFKALRDKTALERKQ